MFNITGTKGFCIEAEHKDIHLVSQARTEEEWGREAKRNEVKEVMIAFACAVYKIQRKNTHTYILNLTLVPTMSLINKLLGIICTEVLNSFL